MNWIRNFCASRLPAAGARRAAAIAVALCAALAGCAAPDPGVSERELKDTPLAGFCQSVESMPEPLVHLAEPLAPAIGRVIASVVLRDGYLDRPGAHAAARARLRPLDLVFVNSKGRLSGKLVPGLFSHVALYLGTEAELKALGVWDAPELRPHHAALRAGHSFIEASTPDVHLSRIGTVLDTDGAAILRPPVASATRRRTALRELAGRIGEEFDFFFDNASQERLYCAELANAVLPEALLPSRRVYGRQTTLPDDVVALAVTGRGKLDFVAYLRGTRAGWTISDRATLIADIKAYWQAAQRRPAPVPPRND